MTLFGDPLHQLPAAKVEQPAAEVEQPAAEVEQPAAEVEQPEVKAMEERTFWDKLFKQEEYSDVTIKLSDRQITCHKAIICNRSDYFQKLCGKDSRFAESDQKVIELKDDNSDAIEAMLVHLYFGPYYSANDTAKGNDWRFHVEVSRVADKYLVHDLKSTAMAKCLELLAAIVEASQICDVILEIKNKFHDVDEVMTKAMALQQQHINALLQEPQFVESLSETEIREQFDRMRGLIGGMIQEKDKLRGKLSGMVEKQGHICTTCGRIFDTSDCKVRSCRGLTTKYSKYWVPKS